jgi:hypothetical protein
MPGVRNATLLGGWHVELQTLIVLGGGANVECIGSMRHPAGADCGVIVDQSFHTHWGDWSFVKVIWTVDLLVWQICWDHTVRNGVG